MPILDSLGSSRGFGFIGKTFRTFFSDNFSRSGALGDPWILTRGTWTANGSQATNSDSASTNPIAVVSNFPPTVTTARINIPDGNAGVGLSFWVTDANNWYAVYPSYTQATVQTCSGSITTTNSGDCCANVQTRTYWLVNCYDGAAYHCGTMNQSVANSICGAGNVQGYNSIGSCYACTANVTSTAYNSNLNLISNGGVLATTSYSTNQSYPRTYSVEASLNNNSVTYKAYSGENATGTTYATLSYDIGSSARGTGIGLFKTQAPLFQGSLLDTFYVSA